jgi:AcrR family transcriptional regulator
MVLSVGNTKLKAAGPANRKAARSTALDEAGGRLLARFDYDQVSVAQIAREAGCSVGAFYGRYRDKQTFLYFVVSATFRTLTQCAHEDLGAQKHRDRSAPFIVRAIVDHVVSRMASAKASGVIRATVKLATFEPLARAPFEDYRKSVAERAIALLAQTSNTSTPLQIRAAIQIVIATVTDAILQKKPGPLFVGSTGLNEALYAVLGGYLGLRAGSSGAKEGGTKGKRATAVKAPEDAPGQPEGHLTMFDPDLRIFQGTTQARTARSGKAPTRKDHQSKASLKGKAGRNSKRAEADPLVSGTIKPPRIPRSHSNTVFIKRKKPRPKII